MLKSQNIIIQNQLTREIKTGKCENIIMAWYVIDEMTALNTDYSRTLRIALHYAMRSNSINNETGKLLFYMIL
jgi:hypothetical protein